MTSLLFYNNAKRFLVGPAVNTIFRPWVKGLDNLPAEGAAILACNHLSFSDSVFIPVVIPRPVRFLAKNDYWKGRGISGRWNRWFFNATGQIPMDRSGGAASQNSLDNGVQSLLDGDLLGIYPEGTRSPDGRLYRGKLGVAQLALRAQVPVIPMALIGTDKVQPLDRNIPRIHRVGLIIGEPMRFDSFYGNVGDRFAQRAVTDQIMSQIMRLSGQEYVDVYASVVKQKLQAQKEAQKSK
ncbi:lysophospholipid acyltransferase family protein [Nesterenkonia alkaliphila]|uniref:lysophospholipid acyltransferase family protein n=1 Tax=Nesterenkonia alkaliphila TaxID=1463631 RepID=UPI00198C30FA|nr:lysophospholipid acyltransferase family protein [Nesterenkonia alkaliphila]GFZ83971.1 1-acyl-sn-glycerol-3-phosphate acyltransferase [Nesterenkonia alkaliphila]